MLSIIRYRYTLIATPNMIEHAERVAQAKDRQWLLEEKILVERKPNPRCSCGYPTIYCQNLHDSNYGFWCVNCRKEVKLA